MNHAPSPETSNSRGVTEFPRCQHRTCKGRCRELTSDPASSLCLRHAFELRKDRDAANVFAKLIGNTQEFKRSIEISLRRAKGEEVLGAFDGILEAAQKLLQVVAAFDEVNLGSVDDQQVGGGVVEKEMFVGAGHFLDVFEGDLRFLAGSFFGDARAEHFGLGLQVDDEVGSGKIGGEQFVVTLVQLELLIVEIEIGEDAVLFEEKVGQNQAGSFDGQGFAKVLLPLDQEVHLRAEGGAGLGFVEVGKEGIVFAIEDPACVEALGKDARQRALADAQRAFDDDKAGGLRTALGNQRALGGRGVVARHR